MVQKIFDLRQSGKPNRNFSEEPDVFLIIIVSSRVKSLDVRQVRKQSRNKSQH